MSDEEGPKTNRRPWLAGEPTWQGKVVPPPLPGHRPEPEPAPSPPPKPPVDVWDKRVDETHEQYLAFVCYRDMPQENLKSITFSPGYNGNKNLSHHTLSKWSSQFDWLERRAAYWVGLRKNMEAHDLNLMKEEAAAGRAGMAALKADLRASARAAASKLKALLEDPGAVSQMKPGDLIALYKTLAHEQHLADGEATSIAGDAVKKNAYEDYPPEIVAAMEKHRREKERAEAELEADAVLEELPVEKQKRVGG
jgi:hypothetical protein